MPAQEYRSETDNDSSDYDDDAEEHRSAEPDEDNNVILVEDAEDDPPDESVPARNLRPNRERDYSHRLAHVMDNPSGTQTYDLLHDAQFFQHTEDNDKDGPMTL